MPPPDARTKSEYDVFVSYAHLDADAASTMVDALRAGGLRVWFDASAIETFERITRAIVDGLARSKSFLAYYSKKYAQRPATQWELTAAVTAVAGAGDAYQRVMVVNPDSDGEHIEPVELRDEHYASPGHSPEDWRQLAGKVSSQVARISGTFGDSRALEPPPWYGLKSTGSTNFVGRFQELWRVHSALFGTAVPVITSRGGSAVAQIRGMGGVGKSLLALEYARRFGAAFRGGVFWLRAFGNDDTKAALSPEERDDELHDQLIRLAAELGVPSQGGFEKVRGAIASRLASAAKPCLWIIDDLPSNLGDVGLQRWFAPHPVAKTLLTTRSREYANLAVAVDVGVLSETESLTLLTRRRQPESQPESLAANAISETLGYHPLAVDVAGSALANAPGLSFQSFLDSLVHDAGDELEFAAELSDVLPLDHAPSIVRTLSRSIERLTSEGKDYLTLACLVGAAPLADSFAAAALALANEIALELGAKMAIKGGADAGKHSLSDPVRQLAGARVVHTLVARMMSFQSGNEARRAKLRAAAVAASRNSLEWILAGRTRGGLEAMGMTPKEADLARTYAIALTREIPDADAAELLELITRYNGVILGESQSMEHDLRRLIEAYSKFHGPDNRNTLCAKRTLVVVLSTMGRHSEARELGEQILKTAKRTLGAGDDETLLIMRRLASARQRMGDFKEALSLAKCAARLCKSRFGDDDGHTLDAREQVAEILVDQGSVAPAIRELESVLTLRKRTMGPSHRDTMGTVYSLSRAIYEIGDFERAIPLMEQNLKALRERLGDDHPEVLTAEHDLALALEKSGDFGCARSLLEAVCRRSVAKLGDGHPDTWQYHSSLASLLKRQGDLNGARRLESEILLKRHRFLGDRHPSTLDSVNSVANSCNELGMHRRAIKLGKWLVQRSAEVFGDQHPKTTVYAHNLIRYLLASGGDVIDIVRTLQRYLLWLKDQDPAHLTADQRGIRTDQLPILEALEARIHELESSGSGSPVPTGNETGGPGIPGVEGRQIGQNLHLGPGDRRSSGGKRESSPPGSGSPRRRLAHGLHRRRKKESDR